MSGDTAGVYIKPTQVLHEAIRELGGSDPIYEDVTISIAHIEYMVSFGIPPRVNGEDMVQISICGISGDVTEDDAKENTARDALEFLRVEHGIHVLDYNWFRAEEFRNKCIPLLKRLDDSESIFEFIHAKCLMVLDGIALASDLFMSKAYDLENHNTNYTMASIFRECATDLQRIYRSSVRDVYSNYNLFNNLRRRAQYLNFIRPYSDDPQLKTEVGAVLNVSSGLKLILNEVALRAGFQLPILTIDHAVGSGYRGYVHLTPIGTTTLSNGMAHIVSGTVASEESEAKNNAMHHAIGSLSDRHGLNIMDPSFYVLGDLELKYNAIKAELGLFSSFRGNSTQIALDALNEMQYVADKHGGSTGQKDAYLNSLITSAQIDLAQHLRSVYKHMDIIRQNSRA